MENKAVHNVILTLLLILSVLFFIIDGCGIYGVMTMFGAFLYLLWNDKDENNDDNYYKFNLR